jgi:hypothetical protein
MGNWAERFGAVGIILMLLSLCVPICNFFRHRWYKTAIINSASVNNNADALNQEDKDGENNTPKTRLAFVKDESFNVQKIEDENNEAGGLNTKFCKGLVRGLLV